MFQFHFVLFLEEVFFFSSTWVLVTARCCVVRSHQHPAVAAGVCLRVYVVCMRVCAVYAQFIPAFFWPFFSISPSVPLQQCFCTPLNYATSAEWSGKKGKREFYNNHFPLL